LPGKWEEAHQGASAATTYITAKRTGDFYEEGKNKNHSNSIKTLNRFGVSKL